ncbi:hypothetical protein BGZ94_001655 [Podila epigama]|nr:hypothetical protein BGZ94_001655 [Podila epigama]
MKDTADNSMIDKTLTALDNYVLLGKSGLRVSPPSLGTMTFGEQWGFGSSNDVSKKIFDRYYEAGGNFFDTANVYTNGESERFLGEYISGKRSQCVVATKYTINPIPMPDAEGNHPRTNPNAAANTLADLRGLSPFIGLQTRYNMLNRSLESDLQPMCAEHGLGIVPWGILAEGFLSGKHSKDETTSDPSSKRTDQVNALFKDPKNWRILEEVKAIALECQKTPAQVVLNWTMQKPGITSPLLGVRTLEQLEDNLGALEFTLTQEQMERLDTVSNPVSWPFPQEVAQNLNKFVGQGVPIEVPLQYRALRNLRTSKI